jgi:hypothetical protein
MNRLASYRGGETDRVESPAFTGNTRTKAYILVEFLPDLIRVGFPIPPFQVGDEPFEGTFIVVATILPFEIEGDRFFTGSLQEEILDFGGQALKWRVDIEIEMLTKGLKKLVIIDGMAIGPRGESAITNGEGGIRDNKFRVEIPLCSKTAAFRTSPMGIIEREHLRGQLRDTDTALAAGGLLAEKNVAFTKNFDDGLPIRQSEGQLYRIGKASLEPFFDNEAVHNDAD